MDATDLEHAAMAGAGLDDTAMNDAMDDLFGDSTDALDLSAAVGLPQVTLPPPPALLQRLVEMQASGCCTKIAWSNTGNIAQISTDGSKILFRTFERNQKHGRWSLSDVKSHSISSLPGSTFVHLAFNHLGQDLAAIDNYGRTRLFSASSGDGKMHEHHIEPSQESQTELNAVVGLYWLPVSPLDVRSLYIGPVSRGSPTWTSQSKTREPSSIKVHHPAENARSLSLVSRNGHLRLFYQQDGWRFVTKSLNLTNSGDLLTHADICEHSGRLLLATMSINGSLTISEIKINWSETTTPSQNQPSHIFVDPNIQITSLTSIKHPAPQHTTSSPLTQLHMIPPTAEVADQSVNALPTIVATFAVIPLRDSAGTQYYDASTTLASWSIQSERSSLHTGFQNLKPSSQAASSNAGKTVLQRRQDIVTSKVILSLQSRYFDTIIALLCSDGTVEFRDRSNFEILEAYMDADHVVNLPQTGFGYNSGEHVVHMATSYDAAAMVVVKPDHTTDSKTMSFRYGWPEATDNGEANPFAEAAVVCLAREYMIMICGNISPDEILALLPPNLPSELEQLFYREIFRLARHGPDISMLEEKMRQNVVLREPLLPRAYSVQLFRGTSTKGERTMVAQHAWAILNLRHVCTAISQGTARLEPSQPFPSDFVHSLRGHARWAVDLLTFIAHSMLTVKQMAAADPSKSMLQIVRDFMDVSNSPAFLLIICSFPRTLLKILVQFTPRLIKLCQVSMARAKSVLERQRLTEVGMLEKTVPFTFEAFKTFLEQVEVAVQSGAIMQQSAVSKPDRSRSFDVSLTLSGHIPDQLEATLGAISVSATPTLLGSADASKLYFADTFWLGLNGGKSVELTQTYDVIKKTMLPEKAVLRHCRRCNSMMEDLNPEKMRELPPWLVGTQRFCVCTGSWSTL